MNASPIRFTGLTSGMDTQSMVQQLMRAESMRMDRLTRRRTMLQWRQESIRGTMTQMNQFRRDNTTWSNTGAINNDRTWITTNASVTNNNPDGNTNGITVTTSPQARTGSFDIRVLQAAQGDIVQGGRVFDNDFNLDTQLRLLYNGTGNDAVAVNLRGESDTYVEINGVNIRVGENYTVRQFMSAVNRSNAGVNMRFDTIRGRFILESTGTGEEATVRTRNDNWDILRTMGLDNIQYVDGREPAPGAATGNPIFPTETNITPSSLVRDSIPWAAGNTITVAGRSVTVLENDTFLDLIGAINTILAGNPAPGTPLYGNANYTGDAGFRIDMSGSGTFGVVVTNPNAIIDLGDIAGDDYINFMFGQDHIRVNNPAYQTGAVFSLGDFNIPGVTGSSTLYDIQGMTLGTVLADLNLGATWEASFVFNGTDRVNFNQDTTIGEFFAALNAVPGLRADFDFETNSFSFHSDTAGAPIPTFEILPVDPADPTNAATAANRATTSTILTELLVGIPVPVAVSNRVAAANAARATSPIHNPSLSQEITDSQSVTITVGTGSDTETTTLNFDPGTSFREIMDAINAIDGVNVTFNSATGQFTFSTTGDEPVGVSGIGFLGFAPTGSISIRQGAAPPTGAVTSNTVNPGTLTPSSYVRDFIDINQYPSITIGGRTITININDTFLDLIGAINSLLAGNPAPGTPLYGNPNYTGDLGFRADLSGNGAFFLVATGTGTASSIEIGEDGESNALLRLMFGADYRTINSPPETFVHNPTLDTQVGAVRIATITVGEGSDAVTTPLTFFNNMTYQQIMDEINNIAGVQMTFDPISGTFTISPTDGQVFRAEGLGFLGFPSTVEGNFEETPSRLVRTAQNAIIYYDVGAGGLPPVRLEQATNNFDLHGMRITLSSAVETATRSDDGTYVGGIFTINSERDIEDTYAAVREFVENYNNLIRMLNDLHSTPRPRAGNHHRGALFEPLTDEERAGMSDRDIERWEEQARTGLLHRDRDIRNIQQQLRDAMFQPVRMNDGTTFSLHQIGIQTIGINGAANDRLIGVLEIDSDRLRAALEQDPDRVRQLFARNHVEANTHDGPTLDDDVNIRVAGTSFEQRNINFRHVGLGFRIHELLDTVANNVDSPLQQRAGYHFGVNTSENTISRQIADYNRRIDAMQQFLIRRENHFFSMFARMEQAMAQSHAQMDSLFAFMTQ